MKGKDDEGGEAGPVKGDGSLGRPESRTWPAMFAVLCLALFLAKAVTSMVQESSTWDETCYFGLGKYLLQNQRWDISGSILHPPLSYYIHSIPMLFFPTDQRVWKIDATHVKDTDYRAWSNTRRGQALLSSEANQGDRLLNLSRLMMVLTAVLLGWFVFLWSYSLYGKWGSILAVVLYSFSPNILAHARLITPDITLTTFSFMTVYYLWRLLRDGRMSDAVLGGICLGLALLSKFTSLLLFPICLALIILWRIKLNTLNTRQLLVFVAIGIGILCLGYGVNLEPYFAGIAFQQKHASLGHSAFLMGEYSTKGWWYYLVIAFLIKTPVAMLIFLAMAMGLFIKKALRGEWMNEAFLLIPAAAIFCFFSLEHQSIGLRYVLPIYPFLFVFAGKTAQICWSKRGLAAFHVALAAWYIGASCHIHPHYLAYFNELVGGPNNGYKYLVDSNLDWGQELKGLKAYMEQHGIPRINLSYFGSDSPERYGISYNWLPSYVLRDPDPQHHEFEHGLQGWVAVSASNLQGVYFENRDIFAALRGLEPAAKIGYGMFVYHLQDFPAAQK